MDKLLLKTEAKKYKNAEEFVERIISIKKLKNNIIKQKIEGGKHITEFSHGETIETEIPKNIKIVVSENKFKAIKTNDEGKYQYDLSNWKKNKDDILKEMIESDSKYKKSVTEIENKYIEKLKFIPIKKPHPIDKIVENINNTVDDLKNYEVYVLRGDDFIPKKTFRKSFQKKDDEKGHFLEGVSAVELTRNAAGGSNLIDKDMLIKQINKAEKYGKNIFLLKGNQISEGNDEWNDEVIVGEHKIIHKFSDEELSELSTVAEDIKQQLIAIYEKKAKLCGLRDVSQMI